MATAFTVRRMSFRDSGDDVVEEYTTSNFSSELDGSTILVSDSDGNIVWNQPNHFEPSGAPRPWVDEAEGVTVFQDNNGHTPE